MLCDELRAVGVRNPLYDPASMKPVLARIDAAVKFELARDFAQAADALAVDLTQVSKALPFCRLPYPEIWIELAARDRQNFVGGERSLQFFEAEPRRVGFLLTATNDQLSAWKAHLFWVGPFEGVADLTNAAAMAMAFDLSGGFPVPEWDRLTDNERDSKSWKAIPYETRRKLAEVCAPCLTDYKPTIESLPLWKSYTMETFTDWAGEPSFLEATLTLLNARNASERVYVDQTSHNIKRAKRGKSPLASHHVLRIHPRQRAVMKAATEAERDRELRAHFVRGHWKVRKSGVYFWRPFVRGRLTRGFVDKDYVVD